jgi:hypothetical protein
MQKWHEEWVADVYCWSQWRFCLHNRFDYSEHDDEWPRTSTSAESGATYAGSEAAHGINILLRGSMEWISRSSVATGFPPGTNTGLPLLVSELRKQEGCRRLCVPRGQG